MHYSISLAVSLFLVASVLAAPFKLSARNVCPYDPNVLVSIVLKDAASQSVHALRVQYIGKGANACAYEGIMYFGPDTELGVPGVPFNVVAKTSLVNHNGFGKNELAALQGIGELYAYGIGSDSLEWIVMAKQPGMHIFLTKAWKTRFPSNYNTDLSAEGIVRCNVFMAHLYKLILDKTEEYGTLYGWFQGDASWHNFMFSDDLTMVNLVDWGLAKRVSSKTKDMQALRAFLLNGLVELGQLPLEDNEAFQGVCQSQRRARGQQWQNPMPSVRLT